MVEYASQPSPGVPLEVDISQLEQAIPWLNSLHNYVANTLHGSVADISNSIQDQQTTFGGFGSAIQAAAKHQAFQNAVLNSYTSIAASLQDAAQATQKIINNYQTAEDRNRANARQIEALFDPGTSTTTGSTSPTDASTTTTTSNTTGIM